MILLWSLAATASPEPPPPIDLSQEAEAHFQLGLRAYEARDLQGAVAHLLASNRLVPNRNVLFNLGRTYEAMGDPVSAWRYYDRFVRDEPDPTSRAEGEEALARIEPRVARVRVESDPPGAGVYLERVDLGSRGQTPLMLALPEGRHLLLVGAPGNDPVQREVILATGAVTAVSIELTDPPPPDPTRPNASVTLGAARLFERIGERCTLLGVEGEPLDARDPRSDWPGSAAAVKLPVEGLVLDVVPAGRPAVRVQLEPLSRKALALRDASALHAVVFERCRPRSPEAVATALEALPGSARRDAVRLFAEWAAWRGADGVDAAAQECVRGACGALAVALAR